VRQETSLDEGGGQGLHCARDEFTERTVYGPGGRLVCAAIPGIVLDLDDLFDR
jgi:hypothetical protein